MAWKRQFDPLGQATGPVGSDHYFRTDFRPYVTFQNLAKQNKCRVKIMITIGGTVGLAEGIIDDTCLVFHISPQEKEEAR